MSSKSTFNKDANNYLTHTIKEKGITLIALVVTIIILLILVGVTISQLSGENGLIKRAKEAVERYKNASEQEQIQLGKVNAYGVLGENEGENNGSLNFDKLCFLGNTADISNLPNYKNYTSNNFKAFMSQTQSCSRNSDGSGYSYMTISVSVDYNSDLGVATAKMNYKVDGWYDGFHYDANVPNATIGCIIFSPNGF